MSIDTLNDIPAVFRLNGRTWVSLDNETWRSTHFRLSRDALALDLGNIEPIEGPHPGVYYRQGELIAYMFSATGDNTDLYAVQVYAATGAYARFGPAEDYSTAQPCAPGEDVSEAVEALLPAVSEMARLHVALGEVMRLDTDGDVTAALRAVMERFDMPMPEEEVVVTVEVRGKTVTYDVPVDVPRRALPEVDVEGWEMTVDWRKTLEARFEVPAGECPCERVDESYVRSVLLPNTSYRELLFSASCPNCID